MICFLWVDGQGGINLGASYASLKYTLLSPQPQRGLEVKKETKGPRGSKWRPERWLRYTQGVMGTRDFDL